VDPQTYSCARACIRIPLFWLQYTVVFLCGIGSVMLGWTPRFGYLTNSRIKLLAVVDEEEVKDAEMRAVRAARARAPLTPMNNLKPLAWKRLRHTLLLRGQSFRCPPCVATSCGHVPSPLSTLSCECACAVFPAAAYALRGHGFQLFPRGRE